MQDGSEERLSGGSVALVQKKQPALAEVYNYGHMDGVGPG